MDTKITMAFDENVISKAKQYAEAHNISLSRLTEFLFRKITSEKYEDLESLPIADWVNMIAEGEVEYQSNKRHTNLKKDFYEKR